MSSSLDSAVAAAEAELKGQAAPATLEETPPEEKESEGEESSEESPSEETPAELSETELLESKNLYRALKNPQQAAAVIAALAQQVGILPKAGEKPLTPKEEVVAKREIKEIFAEALGKEYGFLSDRLGPAIEAVLKQERTEAEGRFAELQQANVEREVVTAYEQLNRETKGESKKFEARMAQLSEEIPVGNMNIKTYMQRLYTLASNERKSSPQKVADQIRRNASDVPARLRSTAVPLTETHVPDKKMSLNESIAWAQDQIQKGRGK